ncbi:MAG: hypothetical protein ACYC9L_16755 [Sulfuricaulis sp.]
MGQLKESGEPDNRWVVRASGAVNYRENGNRFKVALQETLARVVYSTGPSLRSRLATFPVVFFVQRYGRLDT